MLKTFLSLAVIDDHSLFRKAVVDYLARQKDLEVKIDADDAFVVLEQLKSKPVDLVLLDLYMPKMNGFDAFTVLRNEFPEIKIIIMSMCSDLEVIGRLLDLGIYAYILKTDDIADLLEAINTARKNRIYRNKFFTEALYMEKEKAIVKVSAKKSAVNLSDREKRLIQLLWEDKTTKEISSDLFLSISSVEKVKQEVKEKLDVKSVAGLFKYALKSGIISIDKWKLASI
jgi:two-component system nitrate/nitrite response regulator NarL